METVSVGQDEQSNDVDSIEAIRREYRAAIAAMREEHAREVQGLRSELAALGSRRTHEDPSGTEDSTADPSPSGRRRFVRLAMGGAATAPR